MMEAATMIWWTLNWLLKDFKLIIGQKIKLIRCIPPGGTFSK
jgi:hypothetical protein